MGDFMKFLISALLISSSFTAMAQTVGTLENVQGVVSVSNNGVVSSVTGNTSLSNGSVVLNSGSGSSFIRLANGCTVALQANQFVTINATSTCAELTASVKTVGAVSVAGGSPISAPFVVGGGLAAGGAILYNANKKKSSGS
jgi:hypothetical protein